ncbi:MAG: YhbY family RNA-binding protein [Candidatus Nanoarchaeia archaeon]
MKAIKKLQIGKNGLTEAFIEQLTKMFNNRSMVKISILKSACRDKQEADDIGKQIIDKLGNNFSSRRIGYTLVIRKNRR